LLIRFAKRLANWEEPLSIEELQQREFKAKDGGPDLRPSVYELHPDHTEVVRAYAEHSTALDLRTGLGVALSVTNRELLSTSGNPRFAFIRDRHREIKLNSVDELRALIRDLQSNLADRRHLVSKEETIAYARQRIDEGDAEWREAVDAYGAKAWLVKLQKA
jgi:hypothetical protein